MAETIAGGAFMLPDGSWINAAGKKIAAPRGDVYIRPEEPAILTPGQVTPGADEDEYGVDPDLVTEEETGRKKASKKKS